MYLHSNVMYATVALQFCNILSILTNQTFHEGIDILTYIWFRLCDTWTILIIEF